MTVYYNRSKRRWDAVTPTCPEQIGYGRTGALAARDLQRQTIWSGCLTADRWVVQGRR